MWVYTLLSIINYTLLMMEVWGPGGLYLTIEYVLIIEIYILLMAFINLLNDFFVKITVSCLNIKTVKI